jgi:hypothetical protein
MFDFFIDRGIAELLFWWAGVAMPIATVVVILYARAQLTVIANQAQATLLLNLVDKWNSAQMHECRIIFDGVEAAAKEYVLSQHAGLSDKEFAKKLKEHFSVIMPELDKKESQKYSAILQILSFFELVGEFVKRHYVLLIDIDALFRGPILDIWAAYVLHIKDEQQKRSVPPGYYENALFLISEIEKNCPH